MISLKFIEVCFPRKHYFSVFYFKMSCLMYNCVKFSRFWVITVILHQIFFSVLWIEYKSEFLLKCVAWKCKYLRLHDLILPSWSSSTCHWGVLWDQHPAVLYNRCNPLLHWREELPTHAEQQSSFLLCHIHIQTHLFVIPASATQHNLLLINYSR